MTEVLELLRGWMPDQRWFSGHGTPPELQVVGSYELEHPDPQVRLISVAIVRDTGATPAATYQVPLVIREVDAQVAALGFIGQVTEQGARSALVDGAHDPAFAEALLTLIDEEREAGAGSTRAYGQPMPGAAIGSFVTSRVLTGEQSNTSIICELAGADGAAATPIIIKLYRRLHDGDNPDVTLQTALAAAGSLCVPPTFGHVSGTWPGASGPEAGHLAFAEEFFVGVEDAWRVALRAAESGEDFSSLAHSLGAATAEVHATLRRVMPTVDPEQAEIDLAIERMWNRYEAACRLVPELAELGDGVEAVYERASQARWPLLQRIHGDYHLGQVLAVPDRGWVLLDFEGEPLRPLNERNAPDVPERDLAGMLRSFDYVSGSLSVLAGHEVARDWADAARAAFLRGHAEAVAEEGGSPGAPSAADHLAVLDAYELDKAIYESIYEARHRPTWLPVPVLAAQRIAAAGAARR